MEITEVKEFKSQFIEMSLKCILKNGYDWPGYGYQKRPLFYTSLDNIIKDGTWP